MFRYIAGKIGLALFVMVGITSFAFMLGVLSPGDPAEISLSSGGNYTPTPEELRIVRKQMGLDKPYYIQYVNWITQVFGGNLGVSFRSKKPVTQEILTRLPITAAIAGTSVLLTAIFGIGAGILMVLRPKGIIHQSGQFFSMLTISLPGFWLAILLIHVFAERLRWLPTSGQSSWKHLIMPIIVLSAGNVGIVVRLMRSSLDTQMRRHYVLVAASKGMTRSRTVFSHALVNSLIPVVTLLGNSLGGVLGGSVIVESVFAINGLGKYALESIAVRDYPALQGYVLVTGFTFVLINLLLDMIYLALNPQIRLAGKTIS
ncbi:MAG: ABC transporter permease [Oscillospiraceae bacterium]|jgi:peptide/nickel transport system permease protein|nr:ABC transporter permease [Oscillospiraceae bacterium]